MLSKRKQNKKIGFLCTSDSWGGLELNTVRLGNWLMQRGWESIFFAVKNSPLTLYAEKKSIPVEYIKKSWKFLDIRGGFKLARKLRKLKIKYLWVSSSKNLSIAGFAKLFCLGNLRVIYQQHMQIGISKKDIIHTARYSAIDAWIAPLKSIADEVRFQTFFPRERIHIIPLGIELEKFINSACSKEEAKKMLQIPDKPMIVGIIGRIDPLKRQDMLIEVAYYLRKLDYDIELLIVGEPTRNEGDKYLKRLHSLAEKYNLQDKIHFRSFAENVELFYRAMDIFVMASSGETYGMVTLEAMASGVPIVASNSGGTAEIIGKNSIGVLFKPNDVKSLLQKTIFMLDYAYIREDMANRAKQEAINCYSHIRECELVEELIAKLN